MCILKFTNECSWERARACLCVRERERKKKKQLAYFTFEREIACTCECTRLCSCVSKCVSGTATERWRKTFFFLTPNLEGGCQKCQEDSHAISWATDACQWQVIPCHCAQVKRLPRQPTCPSPPAGPYLAALKLKIPDRSHHPSSSFSLSLPLSQPPSQHLTFLLHGDGTGQCQCQCCDWSQSENPPVPPLHHPFFFRSPFTLSFVSLSIFLSRL